MPDRPSGNPSETASEHNPCPADYDIPPEASPERLEQQGQLRRLASLPGPALYDLQRSLFPQPATDVPTKDA